jgi:ATP-dependent Lon protease
MTGELTLTGRVLPVGGIREKILAARRAGIHAVLIPRHNEKDLVELPAEVKADMTFHAIDTLDDVVPRLFPARRGAKKSAPSARGKAVSKTQLLPPPRKTGQVDKPTRRPRSV